MASFDIDAAKLAALLTFHMDRFTVDVEVPDVDGQLNDLEANLGINHWAADLEEIDGVKMTILGYREAFKQTLRDPDNDIDDAEHSSPSRRTDFSKLMGNFTNNSKATICQHQRQETALQTINLVDRNYTLESDLLEYQMQVAVILAQFKLLQDQVAAKQVDHKETDSEASGNDNEEGSSLIQGGYNPCTTSKDIQQKLIQGEG